MITGRVAAPSPLEAGDDRRAALGEAGDDLAFGVERLVVGVGGGDRDVARPRKRWPSVDAAGGEAERRHRHDVGAVQRDQPVRRADELDAS